MQERTWGLSHPPGIMIFKSRDCRLFCRLAPFSIMPLFLAKREDQNRTGYFGSRALPLLLAASPTSKYAPCCVQTSYHAASLGSNTRWLDLALPVGARPVPQLERGTTPGGCRGLTKSSRKEWAEALQSEVRTTSKGTSRVADVCV